eukprot:TRINITY_DN28659_c0_g1_i1.p1 TRINITY_DN28659_c0_g1~~TRINITY_DN28659_c0_g1_i1.p1  ORF type:complete len:324 (+),score=62.14 TRINITY_DN28659_c0_g1_i1:126-1097(+)
MAPAPRSCNVSLAPRARRQAAVRRGRPRCWQPPAYPLAEFDYFLSNWKEIQGFIGWSTAYFIHLVSMVQCAMGVTGALGEVGVAAGKSFAVLAFARRANESLVACDLFHTGLEKDNVPEVNLPMFVNLLEYLRIPKEDVHIVKQSSLTLSDVDLVSLARRRPGVLTGSAAAMEPLPLYQLLSAPPLRVPGNGGYRMFHVDGGHYLEAALSDLSMAACALVPGGVVLVDDLHNLRWPGVQEAFHRYMLAEPPPRRLEPFLYTGRLFLTTPGYASAYRSEIRRMKPEVKSKQMYGSELLTTLDVDVRASDFVQLYADFADGSEPN